MADDDQLTCWVKTDRPGPRRIAPRRRALLIHGGKRDASNDRAGAVHFNALARGAQSVERVE